ncbi:hypothetical protein V8G54_002062 [Vigna mungo]|uniref:Uncharacterized protein n=1 Tax=Vigna mungo TaxID=3915 RepID=A0AAQ3P8K5_VIGMU
MENSRRDKVLVLPSSQPQHGTHRDHISVQVDGAHPSQPSQAGHCSVLIAGQTATATATQIATLFPSSFLDLEPLRFDVRSCFLSMVELHESTLNSLNSPSHDQLSGDFSVLSSAHLTPRGFTVSKII